MTLNLLTIRQNILRNLMKDKEYAERLGKAREWHEIIAVIREFAEKKGYKFAEIYNQEAKA